MKKTMLAALVMSCALGVSVNAQSTYERDISALTLHVQSNPATADGAWLEMKNVLDEWERMVLVFGYAGNGDFAACEEIKEFAAKHNPVRSFRCNPVN